MNVCDWDLRADKRQLMQADQKQDGQGSVWLGVYEDVLFSFVIEFSTLTFILLIKKKKNFTLVSLLSEHDKYISCPKSYYTQFIFHPSMGQKI